jgi:hypothetical protein
VLYSIDVTNNIYMSCIRIGIYRLVVDRFISNGHFQTRRTCDATDLTYTRITFDWECTDLVYLGFIRLGVPTRCTCVAFELMCAALVYLGCIPLNVQIYQ